MDPKLSGLDPKLREAYERVMNGPSSPPPPVPNQAEQTSAPQSVPQTAPPPPNPEPVQTAPPPPNPVSSTISYNANSSSTNQGITAVKRGGSKFSTVFILLGLIVLLVAYTFVWIYVFKLKIPFLPQF